MKRRILWLLGLFLVFSALFYIPFIVDSQEETMQVESRAMMMESAPVAADADGQDDSSSSNFPMEALQTFGIIVLLAGMSTFLSWAVVDKAMSNREDVELLSFNDGKKALEAMTNETCRKILESLGEEEQTASQLSESLDMSIQRVHYNVKKLEEANLVETKSYKYSPKGKEMDVYRLAKKYFFIGPGN